MIIPLTLPNIVAVLNWRWIFSDTGGVANYLLTRMGLIDRNLIWLGNATLAMVAVLVANIWRGSPFFGISILARLQTIPKDYYEAAELDGAGVFQKFFYVTLPEIMDVILLTMSSGDTSMPSKSLPNPTISEPPSWQIWSMCWAIVTLSALQSADRKRG